MTRLTQSISPATVDALADGLRHSDRVLACFDFDGTLAPIVDDPNEARPLPRAERALETLQSLESVSTAVVTGRAVSDVVDRVGAVDAHAGNHGLEIRRNGSVAVHPIARRRATLLSRCCDELSSELGDVPGCTVENKRLTGTVHVRNVRSEDRPYVEQRTNAVVDRIGDGDLEVNPGKAIYEIGPRVPWTKGDAVGLLESLHESDPFVLYVGDDVTDETAFRRIEPDGLGIHVGNGADETTAASTTVRSPREVCHLLEWLADVGVPRLVG